MNIKSWIKLFTFVFVSSIVFFLSVSNANAQTSCIGGCGYNGCASSEQWCDPGDGVYACIGSTSCAAPSPTPIPNSTPTPGSGGPTPTPATPCVIGNPVCPDGTICKLQTLDGKTSSVCIPGSISGDTPLSTAVCAKGLKSADCAVTDESCMTTEEKDIVRCLFINTAIGEIDTDPSALVRRVFSLVLGLAGGIALILIILSGYRRMASQGDPEKATAAKDQFTAAIVGLLFIIFSFVILQIIGFDILKIPGFGQ